MSDPPDDTRPADDSGETVLLMKTWSDVEAETVRQLLQNHGIPCQVGADVPHTVLPISVDGLGEVRIRVAPRHLEEAKVVLAEYRLIGLEVGTGEEAEGDDDGGEPGESDDS